MFGPRASAGSWAGWGVEGVDFLGDGEVLLGDGPVGDLRIDQRHVERLVAEHRGDRFQAHAPVDRLGCQGVAQLVGLDVAQSRGRAGLVDEPGDGVPIERPAVLPRQEQRVPGRHVRVTIGVNQLDDAGVQRQVAVLVEFADRDV